MIFDRSGKPRRLVGAARRPIYPPDNITINPYDPERHVWVVDAGSEQIFKFTNDGKLVMTMGEFRVTGNDETHFGNPSGIAFLQTATSM